MSKEALKLALEALEYHTEQTRPIWKTEQAITAIKQALAAPVQEPVAQSLKDAVFKVLEGFTLPHDVRKILEAAYYTPPPAAQPAPVQTKTVHITWTADGIRTVNGVPDYTPPAAQPPVAQPAPVPCCGQYETCTQACTPRGEFLAKREAQAAQPAPVPEGWKLVPVEQTDEMIDAAQQAVADIYRVDAVRVYTAMIAEAPEPPAPVQEPVIGYIKKIENLIQERDDARLSRDFYKRRADALQKWQNKMRDPERTIVCDILANGHTLEPAGDRYTTPPAQPALVPKGWTLEKNADGTITINCPIGGAVVSALPDTARHIPESILHSLAHAMLCAAAQPPKQKTMPIEDVAASAYPLMQGAGISIGLTHGVQLTHKPTGLTVACASKKSPEENYDKAWAELEALVLKKEGV